MKITISEDQIKKYYLTLHERTIPFKSARDIISNLNVILSYGLERLNFGMQQWAETDKFPSFDYKDSYEPYDMKNRYFTATNRIFIDEKTCPWNILPPSISELYFSKMLKQIKAYEQNYLNNKKIEYKFNKGMAYANLGVAQAL